MSALPPLPGVLAEIAEAAGRETAIKIALEWGGKEVHIPKVNHLRAHPDHPLVAMLAAERAAQAVAARVGGMNIYIPRARRACVAHLAAAGFDAGMIARRLNISDKTARRYIRHA